MGARGRKRGARADATERRNRSRKGGGGRRKKRVQHRRLNASFAAQTLVLFTYRGSLELATTNDVTNYVTRTDS